MLIGPVHLHGGTMGVRSGGQGLGREFVIHLPVTMALNIKPTPQIVHRSEGVTSARHRIWVADDPMDAADSLGTLLEVMGHDVLVA